MHIFPIFRKGRRKSTLNCTYLFEGSFSGSFLLRAGSISLESGWRRFCYLLSKDSVLLFPRSLANLASISCQWLSRTKDPFPNFLWRKGTIFFFCAKGSANHLASFFFLSPFGLLQWPTFPNFLHLIICHGVQVALFDLHSDCLLGLVGSNTEG